MSSFNESLADQFDPLLVALLQATVNSGASDLHITAGRPPTARRDGTLVSFENVPVFEPEDTARIVDSVLLPGARVDDDVVIERSLVMGLVGHGATVADSVVGARGVVPAGTALVDARLPEPV